MSTDKVQVTGIPDPWLSFLAEVDDALDESVEVHCIGAFALLVMTSIPRPTADIDFIDALPASGKSQLLKVGGEGSELAVKHGLYLHAVTIAELPCDYGSRLIDVTTVELRKLKTMLLEPHDLVLTKISRNSPKDRDDVRLLVRHCHLKPEILRKRFDAELRPYLMTGEERTSLTMELWLEEFFE